MNITKFQMMDYKEAYALWKRNKVTLGTSDTKEEIERFLDKNPDTFLVAKNDEGRIIGAIMGGFDGRRGYIHHLAVLPEYQRKGTGTILLERIMEIFKEKQVVKVHLFIEKRNKEVKKFYEKSNWIVRHDLFMMSKTLRK